MFQLPNVIPFEKLQGNLILAGPALTGEPFGRSIIYLVDHHPQKTTTGFILNKPTGMNVGKLVHTDELKPLRQLPVYYGGPCDDSQLLFLNFTWDAQNQLHCQTRVSSELAIQLLSDPTAHLRAFIGHSGWSEGQLADEMEHHSWITAPPTRQILTGHPSPALWKTTLAAISPFHKIISLHPEQPELN